MLSSRWQKVLNDLWSNKLRTVLIVLSIAVGLFAIGTIVSARAILSTDLDRSYAAINPSSGIVRTVERFDEDFVRSVEAMDEVAAVDARRVLEVRVRIGPNEWENLKLFAIEDYDEMTVDIVRPEDGAWPPPEREILIERAAIDLINADLGDTLHVELPGDAQRALRIAGLAHDLVQVPAQFDGQPYGYISFETLEWLGEPHGFNELHVVAANAGDPEAALDAVNQVEEKAEESGFTIPVSLTPQPGQLPLEDILDAVLVLMGMLGLLSLFLSIFLIINTISALLAQQRRQVGVMKAIGARTAQIVGMYIVMVMLYGLLALIIAVPLSVVGARQVSQFVAGLFNFDLTSIRMPVGSFLLQAVIGLTVPVLASFPPMISSLRITAAQALSVFQIGEGRFGAGLVDRLLSGANLWFARRVLRRPLLLSLRNTFRSRGRLALTLITLTLAGAIFIGVFSVRASMFEAVDDMIAWWNFDILLGFSRSYRAERVEQTAMAVPQVTQTDVWLQLPVSRVRDDGSESGAVILFAARTGSELVQPPRIVEGRWLLPEDGRAIVISTIMQAEEGVEIGEYITIRIGGREEEYRVVGVCTGIMVPIAYADYTTIAQDSGNVGQAGAVLVRVDADDAASIFDGAADLETHFERRGLRVSDVQTVIEEQAEMEANFEIVVVLLLVMAVLLAIVGGLGLMGTMSINVIERTREIGVLRAVGAPNRSVARVFILEGIVIGVLSWVFGAVLSIPLGKWLGDAVSVSLMGTTMDFAFSMPGLWLWLGTVIVLSALASFVPARNASQLTVREVLAYE
jgi:putative ABC transport system permease protein